VGIITQNTIDDPVKQNAPEEEHQFLQNQLGEKKMGHHGDRGAGDVACLRKGKSPPPAWGKEGGKKKSRRYHG